MLRNKTSGWKEQLIDYFLYKSDERKRNPLVVSRNSEKLEYAGIKNNPIIINRSTVTKLIDKHSLEEEFLKELDEVINNSIFALDSIQHTTSKIFITDKQNKDGNPIIFIIRENDKEGYSNVNRITSVYDKSNLQNLIYRTAEQDRKIYINPEKEEEFREMGYDIEPRTNNIDKIIDIANNDYESFIKAVIKIEKGIEDNNILDKIYDRYMAMDNVMLINNDIEEIIDKTTILENNKKLKSKKSLSKEKER